MKIQLDKRYRIKGFDYGSNNTYFVTLNTKNRVPYFGEVMEEEMILTEIGKIAFNNWKEIDQHYPYVIVGEFVCMPDHFHGLLQINKPNNHFTYTENKFGPQKDNLADIIRTYKASVKRYANKNDISFEWKSRYNAQIISDLSKIENVARYIRDNPKNYRK